MKRFNLFILLVMCLGRGAAAQPSPVFLNIATLTTRTNIDAKVFINRGLVFYDTLNVGLDSGFLTNSPGAVDGTLFQTRDTMYWTNAGTMIAEPGFIFNTVTATGVHSSSAFNNAGTILGVDAPVVLIYYLSPSLPFPPQWSGPGTNVAIPSQLVVSATNITVSGTMQVGDLGLLRLNGGNVNLKNGTFGAGTISEVDTNATVNPGFVPLSAVSGTVVFAPPSDVYDIYWSITNNATNVDDVEAFYESIDPTYYSPPSILVTFPYYMGTRNGMIDGYQVNNTLIPAYDFFPMGQLVPGPGVLPPQTSPPVAPNFVPYVFGVAEINSANALITNYIINITLVNSAFLDPDITNQVEFVEWSSSAASTDLSIEGMVKFSAPVMDITTGQIETNSIYFLDGGQLNSTLALATNCSYIFDSRPNTFQISRTVPEDWALLGGSPANATLDEVLPYLYDPGSIESNTVPMNSAFYCAQVGRDPETANGLFDYSATILGATRSGMPDLTNEGARIEINAQTNDVSNMRLSAGGVVRMVASTLVGSPQASDYGNMNVDLGNMKSTLLVTNLFPTNFHRLRGDIAAYSVDWINRQTNNGSGSSTVRITNYVYTHVLILDQALRDNFKPTGLNVALRGSNVVVNDPLTVVTSALFQASNLVFNASAHFTSSAATLLSDNLPSLRNLLIGRGGSITADNYINIGVAASVSTVNPTKQNTPIVTITNLGSISSQTIALQSQIFANGGSILAGNNGSLVLNAITNYLGAGGLGLSNTLQAAGDINLTSTSIQVTNSTILAGQNGNGRLLLYASSQLTDHHPNTASTNAYSTNIWLVTGGFSMPVKPASGDLYGTQIKTIASQNNRIVTHVWAGQDLGPNIAGFYNNAVIGHLILDRTTSINAYLQFSAAGKKNAMYVDYLELRDLAFSDYHHGLLVDPNFTIYFANANVEPGKLHQVYSNIVWVPQFAGPNSTTNVPYLGGSNCLMNAALRASTVISTAGDGVANGNSTHPLNNPTVGPVPCPSLVSSTETLSVANGASGQSLVIWTTGQGTVTPNLTQIGVTAGKTNTLTATPASGWLFLGWSGAVTSSKPTISFVTPTNIFSFLTANFITNPFIGLAGSYYGLFIPTNAAVAANNSGFVTFTLNSQGVLSGKLSFASTNYPFASQFNIANTAACSATNGANVLGLSLEIGDTLPGQATGVVSNANFTAPLIANGAPGWSASVPSPEAGSYTLVLPGSGNPAASPGGDSYGTVTVNASGNLTAAGTLADNVSFSQSVPLSVGGQWPFYPVSSGVPQTLIGWVTFNTTNSTFGGMATWIKATGKGTYYTNGFTNTSVVLGSLYSAAYQKTNGLALNGPTITLSGGNLTPAQEVDQEAVNLSGLETYTSPDKSLTLTIAPSSGNFSGQYVVPGTGTKLTLGGVVLQEQGVARGFFLGTNQSGEILLQGN